MISIHSVPKPLREVVSQAISRGWSLQHTKGGRHPLKLVHPQGCKIPLTSTKVSDHRVAKNLATNIAKIERNP